MKLRVMGGEVYVLGLKTALFGVCELVELVIRDGVIEISIGVAGGIEIEDVTGDVIYGIEIQDVASQVEDLAPICCLEGHVGQGQIGRQEFGINSGGVRKRLARL